jgi:general secretion pathway protein E
LTGHLVFSTLHTNDAASAFTRLIDMGVDPFLVATPVIGVLAQRLVRTLCPHCAEEDHPLQDIQAMARAILPDTLKQSKPGWKKPKGCDHCHGTGFKGREGIFELVEVTPAIQSLILNTRSTHEIQETAAAEGFRNMRQDGLIKAWQGKTSVEEVLRVTSQ